MDVHALSLQLSMDGMLGFARMATAWRGGRQSQKEACEGRGGERKHQYLEKPLQSETSHENDAQHNVRVQGE